MIIYPLYPQLSISEYTELTDWLDNVTLNTGGTFTAVALTVGDTTYGDGAITDAGGITDDRYSQRQPCGSGRR